MGAFEMYQKALVGVDITKKSYDRVQKLFDKGVVPAQKRDEAEAQYKAAVATANAAKTQYDMAKNGAELEDKELQARLVAEARFLRGYFYFELAMEPWEDMTCL
jgi:HlyD family secretion protein